MQTISHLELPILCVVTRIEKKPVFVPKNFCATKIFPNSLKFGWRFSKRHSVGPQKHQPRFEADLALLPIFPLLLLCSNFPSNSLFVPCKPCSMPNSGVFMFLIMSLSLFVFANSFSKWMWILSSQISQ